LNIIALASNFHFALLFLLFLILTVDIELRKTLINGFTFGLFIAILLNSVERIIPLPFTMQSNRSAGFFLNANGSAEAIVFLLLARFLSFPEKIESNSKVAGFAVMGLACSLSRGGAILMIITLALAGVKRILLPLKATKSFAISYGSFLVVLIISSMFLVSKSELPRKSREARPLGDFAALISGGDTGAGALISDRFSADSSAQQRLDLAVSAFNRILDEKIIWGLGVGALYSQKQRTHNFFLESWIETGVFSLFFLPLLLILLIKLRSNNPAVAVLAVVIFVVCFLSHNIINSKIITYAVALAFSKKNS
jgi:hypothetical protein